MRTIVILLLLTAAAHAESMQDRWDKHRVCMQFTQQHAYNNCMRTLPASVARQALLPQPPQPRQPLEMGCFQIGRFLDCSSEY